MHELIHALRSLRSWRLGAVVAVLTLAVGIGTATSMYALVRTALRSTIPDVEDLPSLGRIYASSRTLGVERAQLTLRDVDVLTTASSFESVAAHTFADDADVGTGDSPATIAVGRVSSGFFSVTRARVAIGRLFTPGEFSEGTQVAVVSDRTWRAHFAGRSPGDAFLAIDGKPWTIVGVLAPGFGFPFIGISADAWTPIPRGPAAAGQRVSILARLKPGTTWTAAAAELDGLARPLNPDRLWTWSAIPVQQDVQKRSSGGLLLLFGPAFVVLLIGCSNVACMLLARGVDRDIELSVRAALGASRWRILRQLVGENLALAVVGGTLGTGLAFALLKLIGTQLAQFRPEAAALVPSTTTLLPMALAFSLVACVAFGTLPAVRLSRRDIATSLKGGTSPAVARFVGYRARDLVVFLELGIAVGLVVTAAMFTRFFVELQRVTPRFPAAQILAVETPADGSAAAAERVAALPGISEVTVSTDVPGRGRSSSAARVSADNGRAARASLLQVAPSFFHTLGIPIVRGRSFDLAEAVAHDVVAVVSETAAATLWPGGEAIGARLTIAGRDRPSTALVIGVCRDALDAGGLMKSGLLAPDIYLPLDVTRRSDSVLLLARAKGDPHLLVKAVGVAARPPSSTRTPRVELLSEGATFVPPDSMFVVYMFGGFGVVSLLLAASGIFGVISQSVAQRTTEFGVRMALGATSSQVLRMVLVREGKLIAAALGTGVLVTVLVTRSAFVEMLVISGSDPRLWVALVLLCGGTAATALVFATCRIVRLDPGRLLKQA